MAEFRWIKTSLLLILVLQFTATLGQYTSFIVRDGGEVTLPCSDVTEDQDNCYDVTWSFGTKDLPEDLFLFGKKNENTKADRLSVTESCSLVIKKVTAEDAGQYICQHNSRTYQVYLSVVTMTEHQDMDEVTLTCSVSPYGKCEHTVKWLNEDEDNKDMMTSQSNCSDSATTFLSASKNHECEVTDVFRRNTKQFIYLDSDEKTGEDEKTSTSKPTTTTATKPPATTTTKPPATTTTATKPPATTTTTTTKPPATTIASWWWFIILPVVLAALLVVVLIRWKRTKGNKTQVDANTADPEDGVSYVSVSFTKTTNSKARVQGNVGDNEGDAVTYSTVKASSSA